MGKRRASRSPDGVTKNVLFRPHEQTKLFGYREAISCHRRTLMNADRLPDDLPIRSLGPTGLEAYEEQAERLAAKPRGLDRGEAAIHILKRRG